MCLLNRHNSGSGVSNDMHTTAATMRYSYAASRTVRIPHSSRAAWLPFPPAATTKHSRRRGIRLGPSHEGPGSPIPPLPVCVLLCAPLCAPACELLFAPVCELLCAELACRAVEHRATDVRGLHNARSDSWLLSNESGKAFGDSGSCLGS